MFFDEILKQDLIRFKSKDNIYEIENSNIHSIIRNRTRDKLYLLQVLLNEDIIDTDYYNELYYRIKSDFKMSHLYILGLCKI